MEASANFGDAGEVDLSFASGRVFVRAKKLLNAPSDEG